MTVKSPSTFFSASPPSSVDSAGSDDPDGSELSEPFEHPAINYATIISASNIANNLFCFIVRFLLLLYLVFLNIPFGYKNLLSRSTSYGIRRQRQWPIRSYKADTQGRWLRPPSPHPRPFPNGDAEGAPQRCLWQSSLVPASSYRVR